MQTPFLFSLIWSPRSSNAWGEQRLDARSAIAGGLVPKAIGFGARLQKTTDDAQNEGPHPSGLRGVGQSSICYWLTGDLQCIQQNNMTIAKLLSCREGAKIWKKAFKIYWICLSNHQAILSTNIYWVLPYAQQCPRPWRYGNVHCRRGVHCLVGERHWTQPC